MFLRKPAGRQRRQAHLIDPFVRRRDFEAAVLLGVLPQHVVHLDAVAVDTKLPFLLLVCSQEIREEKIIAAGAAAGDPCETGMLFCKLTFLAAVIVEDVVTQSAPTLLPVGAEEAVICGGHVEGDRRWLVCFQEKKLKQEFKLKHEEAAVLFGHQSKPLHAFCICAFSVIFVLCIHCSHSLLYLYSIEGVKNQGAFTLSALLEVSSFKHRRQFLGCHCWRLLSIWKKDPKTQQRAQHPLPDFGFCFTKKMYEELCFSRKEPQSACDSAAD